MTIICNKAGWSGATLAACLAAYLATLQAVPALAAEARIAVQTETTSIDPMFHNVAPNIEMSRNMFDTLIAQDNRQRLLPSLALSWTPTGPTAWEIKLRPGVTFSDGTPLTADDIAFSIDRAPKVPNSPSSFGMYTKAVARTEVTDPLTLRIETNGPAPLLPNDLSVISIVSRKAAQGRSSAEFDSGAAAVGTGPYRFIRWDRGNQVVMEHNPAYWGAAQPGFHAWDRLVIRAIPNGAARAAAVLSGDVDLAASIPSDDIARLKADNGISLFQADSNRLIFLQTDSSRDRSPGLTDTAGKPLDRNPFRDQRVREALSVAINREALTGRLLNGQAKPAGQLLPPGFFGTSDKLVPPPYDPARAKRLLAEAGWGGGFGLRLAASNDRYPKDSEVAQAVAQMLTRVDIATQVDAMPASMLFSRGSKLEFSAFISGWIAASGEASSPLVALLATYDPVRGFGPSNRGRYSNPEFDRLLNQGLQTLDEASRGALLAQATEVAMRDVGLVPLYFLVNTWATRKGFRYDARSDEMTIAAGLTPAAP